MCIAAGDRRASGHPTSDVGVANARPEGLEPPIGGYSRTTPESSQLVYGLAVMSRQVVQSADRWFASDGAVVPVVIVGVEPAG